MNKIAIFGAGGFGREVKWLIDDINAQKPTWDFLGYYDDNFLSESKIDKQYYLGTLDDLNQVKEPVWLVLALGNPIVKKKVHLNITNPLIQYPVLIHPTCSIGIDTTAIGNGSIICAGTIITRDIQIGRHVILNLCCTVGHDTVIGDYSSFMPSVNISGEVLIEECVYGGTGAKIINQTSIGKESILGAGAVVSKSIPEFCTAIGIPAKVIKQNQPAFF
jgi:sugar O-acyltransferase (sialic acid O-acetyltransferase NeuD family)